MVFLLMAWDDVFASIFSLELTRHFSEIHFMLSLILHGHETLKMCGFFGPLWFFISYSLSTRHNLKT